MKKPFILTLVTVLIPMMGCAGENGLSSKAVPAQAEAGAPRKVGTSAQVVSLVTEFSMCEGFNIVQVGKLGTGLIKKIVRAAADPDNPEEKALLDMVNGIKKVSVIEYSECDEETRAKFVRKLERIIPEENLLIDIKDDGEKVRIFGVVSEEGGSLQDFILHAPDESALVCLFGSISMDSLSKLLDD